MILLRIREWGTDEWTQVQIDGPDSETEDLIASYATMAMGNFQGSRAVHAQRFDDALAIWRDVEDA